MYTGIKVLYMAFFVRLTIFLRCPQVSDGVSRVKDLLSHFDRQFPISYSYIFLQI